MIELSYEQRQAVSQGEPVRLVDPTTNEAYVLVRAEEYAPGGIAARPFGTSQSGDPASGTLLATGVLARSARIAKGPAESWEVGGVPRRGSEWSSRDRMSKPTKNASAGD